MSASSIDHEQHAATAARPLEGRVAIVTGAAGGLGRAIAEVLRERGATVHGVDIAGDDVFHADLSTVGGNRAMIHYALELDGRLDILVLNAGVQHVAPLRDFPEEQWDRLLNVMLKGPFIALQEAWPALIERPGGRVVVTASTSSWLAEPRKAGYIAAKHGVLGLVRVAALEGADHGLTVNAVAPGWMDTGMVRGQLAAQAEARGMSVDDVVALMISEQPGNRFIDVREVADTVAFLADPRASAVNGVCVAVDLGGSALG